MELDKSHNQILLVLQCFPTPTTKTNTFQPTIAPFSSTYLFAPPLHMPFRLIKLVQQKYSPDSMTITLRVSIKISRTHLNKSRATLHPLLSILSPEIATIAMPLTDNGSARSLYPDVEISRIQLHTCNRGQ